MGGKKKPVGDGSSLVAGVNSFHERYYELLSAYAQAPPSSRPRYLTEASKLGQELLRADFSPELIGGLHSGAVEQLAARHPDMTLAQASALLTQPLSELLKGYGQAFRERQRGREQLLLQKVSELEELNQAKSAFVANVTHEIRTPMNAVMGMTLLLSDTSLNEQQAGFVKVIRDSGKTLLAVVNDILDYTKLDAQRMSLEDRPFILRKCIESALDMVAPAAFAKELDLVYSMAEDVPEVIRGDDHRLRQVLLNLLSNATKFTVSGHISLTVATCYAAGSGEAEQELHITVTDTGAGIAAERIDSLFQPFQQEDSSISRRYGGTGLGLAISRQLVTLMGGQLWVESEFGSGSAFQFTMRANPELNHPRAEAWPAAGGLAGLRAALALGPYRQTQRVVCELLERWGMSATVFSTPEDIIADGASWDVAVVDASVAGEQTRARLRSITAYPPIVLTPSGAQTDRAGDAVFIPRPLKPAALYKVLLRSNGGEAPGESVDSSTNLFDRTLGLRAPLKILLAEDNMVNRFVILKLLKRFGYKADVAPDGVEALRAVKQRRYDLVLMDVQMPQLDGLEASRRIRAEVDADRQPYIVALTATSTQQERERCDNAGMDDFVGKPIPLEKLRAIFEHLAQRSSAGLPPSSR